MKKLFTTLLMLIVTLALFADPVSKSLAKKVAINFISAKKNVAIDTFNVKSIYTHVYKGKDVFYVFSFVKGGFAIISADDEAKPIIGYSLTSPAKGKIENTTILNRFDWYAKQVENAANMKIAGSEVKQEWKDLINGDIVKGFKAAGPLLQTIWNQSPLYNDLCPNGTPTGCVATAMSQIMRYHQWPTSGSGWHKYIHSLYGVQYANFEAETYDWGNMPIELTSSNSYTEKMAIATLCYHAGVSVNMNYASDGSGAYSQDVLYALTSYFKYDPSTINIYDFDATQQTSWVNMIKSEIDAQRPVYYSGSSDADGGHAWVCDGYDDSDNLHINWGWGGYYNGYFVAAAMNPGTYSFSENNSIITGIKPGTDNQPKLWTRQASAFETASRGIQFISAVNKRVGWAVAYDGSGNKASVKDYTVTIDGGKTWTSGTINTANTTGFAASMITAVNDKTAWVALYDGANGGGKIVKTTDGGKNWIHQSSATFTAPNGFPNVIHFWDENNGFCMGDPNNGYFEIYTTTNGGSTWTRVSAANIPANIDGEYGVIGYYEVYGNTVWFSTNKGRLFKSTDKGYTWVVYQAPMTSTFEVAFKNESIGVLQTRNSDSVTKYYKTTNGGEDWTEYTPAGNFYTADFTFLPGTDTLISAGSDYNTPKMGISYSTDDGTTFTDYANFYKNYQFLALGASPDGAVWAGGFNSNKYYGGFWYKGESVLSANFNVNKTSVVKNDSSVIYTNTTYGSPEIWEWDFGTDASPATKTGIGPHTVKYTSYGDKTVTLTVTKGNDVQVYVKENLINVTWPSDVETQQNNNGYLLYPNPANSAIYVKIKGFEKGTIKVYSITGALVWQSSGITDDNRIDISNLSSGVYIVNIQNIDGSRISRKLSIFR